MVKKRLEALAELLPGHDVAVLVRKVPRLLTTNVSSLAQKVLALIHRSLGFWVHAKTCHVASHHHNARRCECLFQFLWCTNCQLSKPYLTRGVRAHVMYVSGQRDFAVLLWGCGHAASSSL